MLGAVLEMQVIEKFLVPREPRLSLGMFFPRLCAQSLPFAENGGETHYLFWARNAIYHGLRALKIASGENVLVPSFHCTSVVEPILKYGAAVKFYDIERTLQPNLAHVEAQIDAKTRAILVIHYFGFPQDIRVFKDLTRRHNLFLIEDCAHVLRGCTEDGAPLGRSGDISIFSWRKFLPLYDGGQLVINNPKLNVAIPWDKGDWFFSLKVAKNVLDKLIDDSDFRLVQKVGRISRLPSIWARRLASTNGHSSRVFSVNSYDLEFDLSSANLGMSNLSKHILRNTSLDEVVKIRRRNYVLLLEFIKSLRGIAPLYGSLPEGVCPWVLPIVARQKNFHVVLRREGIPAFTWSGVIHSTLPLNQFADSSFLYDNLVFLPIHQGLRKRDLEVMAEVLRRSLDSYVYSPCKKF